MTKTFLDTRASNPEWLHFQITERCLLNCPMCYVQDKASGSTAELSSGELKEHLLPLCREYGIHRVVITGGEPFLRRDLVDLLQLFSDWGFDDFYFGSTLLGAKEAVVKGILEIPGKWNFQVSVDSIRPETLRTIRGSDLWSRQVAILEWMSPLLAQHQRGILFSCVLSPDNLSEVPEVMSYLKNRYPTSMLFIQPVHTFDSPYAPQAVPGKRRYAENFVLEVERLALKLQEMKNTLEWESFLAPLSAEYLKMFKSFFDCKESFIKPCRSSRFLFVNSTGMIRGCLFSERIANVRNPLEAIAAARQEFHNWTSQCGVCIHGCS